VSGVPHGLLKVPPYGASALHAGVAPAVADSRDNNGALSSECSSATQNPWDFTAYTVAWSSSATYTSGDVVSYGTIRRINPGRPGRAGLILMREGY